jgi:Mannosyltransferase (PIG-V)
MESPGTTDPPAGAATSAAWASGVRARLIGFARSQAARDCAIALVSSRILIWVVGVSAYLHFGVGPDVRFDHSLLTQSQGAVGNVLIAPAVRWDSNWYVDTALAGYLRQDVQPAFFPFYSLLMRWLGAVVGSVVLAGILISFAAFFTALVMLHRLTERELGSAAARRTVYLLSFFPFALFFSALYTEALFLALALGTLWSGRRGRWWLVGLLGAAAAATRNIGVMLAAVMLFLYLYGPRDDLAPDRPDGGWRPRYRLRADVAWLLLIPAGLVAYLVSLWIAHGDPLVPFRAQGYFQRSFEGPLSAVWQGGIQAGQAAVHLIGGAAGDRLADLREIGLFAVAAAAVVAAVGVFRRLPVTYGVYTLVMAVPVLSFPQVDHPLASASRYLATVFPLFMWAGWRLRGRWFGAVLVLFAIGLVYTSAMFATWHFVA